MSKVSIEGNVSGTGTFTIAAPNSNSNYTLNLPASSGDLMTTATSISGSQIPDGAVTTAKIADSNVTTAKIADANVTVAKLSATGTPSSSTFLRGDGSWQAVSTTPTTDQVLTATAGATSDAIGTYSFLSNATRPGSLIKNTTYAGSNLIGFTFQERLDIDTAGSVQNTARDLTARVGTWRAMSTSNTSLNASWGAGALMLRIS